MTYTDYYNPEEFDEALKMVSFLDKSGVDPFYNLNHNVKGSNYKIDKKGYLYFILGRYTVSLFKVRRAYNYLNSHPYILDYSSIDGNRKLFTSLGNVSFMLCVNSIKEACMTGDDKKTIDVLCNVYVGKYATKCHEVSSILGVDYEYITTAFVNSPLEHYKYLHSFVEDGENVYDFAKNLKMKKDDYYGLINPEVVSKIRGDNFISDLNAASHSYPPMRLKDFLVRHDELILKK